MPNSKHITADQLQMALVKVKDEIDASGGGGGGSSQIITTYTLVASGWLNGVYGGIQTTYPNESYNVIVSPFSGMTDTQLEAFTKAQMVGYVDSNNIKANGTIPTIDIPVMLTVTAK